MTCQESASGVHSRQAMLRLNLSLSMPCVMDIPMSKLDKFQ